MAKGKEVNQQFSFDLIIDVFAPTIEDALLMVERRLSSVGFSGHTATSALNVGTEQEWSEAELLKLGS
jgi:hypothetical protein